MTKQDAIDIFGGRAVDLAKALGLSKGRVSQLPDELTPDQRDRVLVAAIRAKKMPPDAILQSADDISFDDRAA